MSVVRWSPTMGQWLSIMASLMMVPHQLMAHASSCELGSSLSMIGMDAHFIATTALFMGGLLMWAYAIAYALHQYIRIPTVAGYIIAGVFLGASGLNIASWPLFAHSIVIMGHTTPFAELMLFFLAVVSSTLTVPYLLFIAGYETNIQELRSVGYAAVYGGVLGAVLPIALVVLVFTRVPSTQSWGLVTLLGVGLTCSATSVSIPVALLSMRQRMHTKSARATLGAAIVDDVVAIILLSLFFMLVVRGSEGIALKMLVLTLSMLAGTMGGLWFLGRYAVPPVLRYLVESVRIPVEATATMLMFFLFAYTELCGGLAGLTGAYFAGMIFNYAGADKGHTLLAGLAPFVNAVLLPLFLATIGLQLSINGIGFAGMMIIVLLLAVAIVSKLLGCFLAIRVTTLLHNNAREERFNALDTYLFGAGMVARGEVGFVMANILRGCNIMSNEQHGIVVMVLVLTTIAAPILLQVGFAMEKGE